MMKTSKEYPATHSMDTAWYIADAEGNVAIFDFEDNGPVPWGVEQTCVEELIFGHEENYKTGEFIHINLTDEQLDELLEDPHSPEEEDLWLDRVIEIDTSQEELFLELAPKDRGDEVLCLSRNRGLYKIQFYDSTTDDGKPKPNSALRRMLDKGVIRRVFRYKTFWMNDIYSPEYEGYKLEKSYDSAPYYIYFEPYNPEFLQLRVNVPSNPVKLSQVPQPLREHIPTLPIRFDDYKHLQIAEFLPSGSYATDGKPVRGYEYVLVPSMKGEYVWVKSAMLAPVNEETCFDNGEYRCGRCENKCGTIGYGEISCQPTVVVVYHPQQEFDYNFVITSSPTIRHSIVIPLESDFLFEHTVKRFRPYVILSDEQSLPVLKKKYGSQGRNLIVRNNEYPLFSMQEFEVLTKEIETLARMPYRGEVAPQTISVEEMKKLYPDG